MERADVSSADSTYTVSGRLRSSRSIFRWSLHGEIVVSLPNLESHANNGSAWLVWQLEDCRAGVHHNSAGRLVEGRVKDRAAHLWVLAGKPSCDKG